MSNPILVIDKIHKKYQALTAVKEISFSVLEGEIFSLLGPNGAGKTTTISMLSCLIQPTSGDATLGGHSIVSDAARVKEMIGIVPQEIALYEALTATQNLSFWGRMYGMGGNDLKERIDEVLKQVELFERAGERIETYSGGMKRRLNIAAGLLHRPRILFMDEPTVGIDPQSRRNILDMVKALREEGMTVIYTTHYMEEAEELSNRVGIIDKGELIALGTQSELSRVVGEKELITLHIPDGEDVATRAKAFQALESVQQASNSGEKITLTVNKASDALPAIMLRANEIDLPIRSLDIEEPNLEAVFLQLTGRALRE